MIRITPARSKDFNVIGSGSAFAYLGETNLLERSYDGFIYEFHHPSFSSHFYTEKIDKETEQVTEEVRLLSYADGSVLKTTSTGLATFLHPSDNRDPQHLHERWLQLFTDPQYHS